MNILMLLLKEWKLSIAGILLFALIIMYGMYSHQVNKVEDLQKEIIKLELALEKSKAEYKALDASVTVQNNKIKELNDLLESKKKQIKQLEIDLAKARGDHNSDINTFATTSIVTKPTTTNCENNKIIRNDGSEEVNKQWINLFQTF